MTDTLREFSKGVMSKSDGEMWDHNTLQTGAILRIADAVEKMAKPHREAIDRAARYERWYTDSRATNYRLRHSLAAQKGQCTKLRKEIARLKGEAK